MTFKGDVQLKKEKTSDAERQTVYVARCRGQRTESVGSAAEEVGVYSVE